MNYEEFKELNKYATSWNKWPGVSEEDKERDYQLYKEIQDFLLNSKPITGHAVKFPNGDTLFLVKAGKFFQFTEIGSFYVSNGYTSYSGGFDFKHDSIKSTDIGKKIGTISLEAWFPHKGWLVADSAVWGEFEVPVYEVR